MHIMIERAHAKSLKTFLQKMMEKSSKINFGGVPLQKMETLQCSNSKMSLLLLILHVWYPIPLYISCNPESLVANAIELCTPSPGGVEKGKKDNRGWRNMSSAVLAWHLAKSMPVSPPFRPVKAMAVDLFLHTPHCEMVMLLERWYDLISLVIICITLYQVKLRYNVED
ncbi:uncharacterized protein LOC111302186 isoform X1 [Durio zibethinus]|uniref:Uncharacterized protein LOC111302186 isoform X1 n=1 Tax=Durio zibethinus TaxID=66656 RepID=A0A6P5ZLS5_DURZI|nr:uncharacterized protein LOC111302186 isoform X1 [Durio zibethinus]XP_022753858.1 uncharacterized protein LOC111302186 isoform X1 [Durio zibethinus]